MTEVFKGCPFAGCNAPESECSGECVLGTPRFFIRTETTPAASEPTDNPLMCEILGFLNDLCHPEQYGHAVTREVRRRARELATAVETAEGML